MDSSGMRYGGPSASSDASALGGGGVVDDASRDTQPHLAMLWMFVAFLIGAFTKHVLFLLNKYWKFRFPYSVVLLLMGGWLGYAEYKFNSPGSTVDPSGNLFYKSQGRWSAIYAEPTLLLFMFLPPLIFESAMSCNYFIFSSHAVGAILLAGPGMLLQVFLIAGFLQVVLPYGWGITESCLLGGILSATDPIAVIATLKELGAMPDLTVLIEGESIMNDGTSIVVYELCYAILFEPATNAVYFGRGVQLIVGGPILGALFFCGTYMWLTRTKNPQQQTIVTISVAYLSYFVAEATQVRVSGVLAVFTLGILMAAFGRRIISYEAEETLHAFCGMLIQLSETIIFLLAGVLIMNRVFLAKVDVFKLLSADFGYLFLLYIILTLIRGLVVCVCGIYFRRYGHNLDANSLSLEDFMKKMFVITWGGMRGAVGLALALSVNVDTKYRMTTNDPLFADRALFFTAGIVTLTLLINATTLEYLIDRMGLVKVSQAEKEVYRGTLRYLEDTYNEYMDEIQRGHMHPEFITARWDWVRRLTMRDVTFMEKESIITGEAIDPSEETSVHGWGVEESEESKERSQLSRRASIKLLPDGRIERVTSNIGNFALADNLEMQAARRAQKDTAKNIDDIKHARFLMTLKVFYSLQYKKGLMSNRPYDALMNAIDQAIFHVGKMDSNTDDEKGFELAYLRESSLFKLAKVFIGVRDMTSGLNINWIDTSIEHIVNSLVKEMLEAYMAVISAHTHTGHLLFDVTVTLGQNKKSSWDIAHNIVGNSRKIVVAAEEELRFLGKKYPQVVRELSTENASSVVLKGVQADARKLWELGQLSTSEWKTLEDRLETHIYAVRNHPSFGRSGGVADELHNVPFFNVVDIDTWDIITAKLGFVNASKHAAGDILIRRGDIVPGLWFVANGSVRSECWDCAGGILGEIPIYSGGIFGEIDVMTSDVTCRACRSTVQVTCTTPVEIVNISLEDILWIFSTFTEVRQRVWQLYGKRFIQMQTKMFKNFSLSIFDTLKFGNGVIRRPAQYISVKHKFIVILLRGSVLVSNGENITNTFAVLVPRPGVDETLTFTSKDTIVMLFRNENSRAEHSHISRSSNLILEQSIPNSHSTLPDCKNLEAPDVHSQDDSDIDPRAQVAELKMLGRTHSWKDTSQIERAGSSFKGLSTLETRIEEEEEEGKYYTDFSKFAAYSEAASSLATPMPYLPASAYLPAIGQEMRHTIEASSGIEPQNKSNGVHSIDDMPQVSATVNLLQPNETSSLAKTGGLAFVGDIDIKLDAPHLPSKDASDAVHAGKYRQGEAGGGVFEKQDGNHSMC